MSTGKPVVVYGASGYTGRLVCEYLREYNLPFIAAGRSAERVQDALNRVPGIETADYEVRETEHTVEALTSSSPARGSCATPSVPSRFTGARSSRRAWPRVRTTQIPTASRTG